MRASIRTHCAALLVLAALSVQRCVGCPSWTISTSTSPQAIPRDHCSTATVTARVTQNGQPKANVAVEFSVSSFGEFADGTTTSRSVTTNAQGIATVSVRSDVASSAQAVATVTAKADGLPAQTVDVTLRGISIALTANRAKLIVNLGQTALFTATARDSAGTPCKGTITFQASAGSWGNGQPWHTVALDPLGRASAVFTATPTSSTLTAGVAAVIEYVQGTAWMPLHQCVIRANVAPNDIVAGREGVSATVAVVDAVDGQPVEGVPVTFHWAYPPNLDTSVTLVTSSDGMARHHLQSAPAEGTGQFQAYAAGLYSRSHPLRWHIESWYNNIQLSYQEGQGIAAQIGQQSPRSGVTWVLQGGQQWKIGMSWLIE